MTATQRGISGYAGVFTIDSPLGRAPVSAWWQRVAADPRNVSVKAIH
jgi:hypothetical protein